MNEWPEGWNNDARQGRGRGPQPDPTRVMPHTRRPAVPPQARGDHDGRGAYGGPGQQAYAPGYDGYSQGQVYGNRAGGPGGPGGYPGAGRPTGAPHRPNRGRRVKLVILTLVVVVLAWSIGTYFWADGKLRRDVDLSIVESRPDAGEGTNYLIVGSDSREGMSDQEKKDLHTGSAEGKRTDSMILLHVGDNGNTMVSLPRDSWVTIPPFTGSESGKHFDTTKQSKLNAAYAEDGPTLLVRTVEYNTGLHIDHYAEIGFDGFAKVVDGMGGVEMDIPRDIKDEKSGADLRKGRQTLDGKSALAFVRTRYALPGSDLDRTKNQQKFLAALAHQAASPGNVINPFTFYPTLGAGLDALVVDKDMSLWNLASMFLAMKDISGGEGKQMNMPIGGTAPQNSLLWDKAKKDKLMDELKNDQPVTVASDR